MLTLPSRDLIREIEFPDGVDRRQVLRDLNTETWRVNADYRRNITRASPLLFSIVYMDRRLRQQDSRLLSFSQLHLDLCTAARRWVKPGPCRDAWVAPREAGKALALDTPVLTVDRGWTTHGDLKVGDRVFDELGDPCNVVAVSPVWENRPTYRIKFSDGEEIVADENHEWHVTDRYRTRPGVQTTREISEKWLLSTSRGWPEVRYSLPVCGPLQYPTAPLPIAPYVLGAWLGDGTSGAGQLTCGAQDIDEMVAQLRAEGENPNPWNPPNKTAWMISLAKPRPHLCRREHPLRPTEAGAPQKSGRYLPCRTCIRVFGAAKSGQAPLSRSGTNLPLLVRLRDLDLLHNKHIPEQYFTASMRQRLDLLQGLMDTDGSVGTPRPNCEFTGMNERLCRDVLRLAQSLGIKASIAVGRATIKGVDKGPKWRVTFYTTLPVFRLSRKLARQTRVSLKRAGTRQIVGVERADNQATSCIQVDSPSHLYLVGRSLISTHNSAWMFGVLPLWALAHGWKKFFLAFSHIDNQARGHLTNMLDELRSNELLLADFPDLAPRRGQASASRTVLVGGATLAARGMGGTSLGIQSATGTRPDLIVGDDLEPGEVDNSPAEVVKNRSRLLRNILPMNTRAVVQLTGTVTMHGSLVHDLVDAAKGRDANPWVQAQGFVPHYYPALLEDGTSLWPQRWSVAELERMRDEDPHGYALNYDNDPLPPSELTYWKPEMFQFDRRFPTVARVLHIDVAVTTNKTSDYTVLTLLGQDASRQRALVEDVRWGRWTAPEIREQIHDMCGPLRVKPLVRVEATQGGATWLDSLAPWPVGVTYELTHPRAPKAVRIGWALKHYTRRAVWHPWPLEEFQAELCRYPRGAHDDVPDSLAGALEWAFPIQ